MPKSISIITIVFISLTATMPAAFATSGACSDHRGVNCSAVSANGSVICNDGWTGSTVSYDSMSECEYNVQTIALEQEILNIETKYQSDVATAENNTNIPQILAQRQIASLANKANEQIQNIKLQEQQLYLDNLEQSFVAQTPSAPQAPSATPGVSPSTNAVPTPVSTAAIYSIGQNLTVGDSGDDVITLQNFLEINGFLTLPSGILDGYFGNLTKQALVAFQQSTGLPSTGYCGPMTRAKINHSQ